LADPRNPTGEWRQIRGDGPIILLSIKPRLDSPDILAGPPERVPEPNLKANSSGFASHRPLQPFMQFQFKLHCFRL
jgi:hypothetical protein